MKPFNPLPIIYYSLLAFIISLSGCSPSGISVVPVSGKITFEGKPLEGARITFFPAEPDGRQAGGLTEEDGTFMLMTQGAAKSGCLPGNYRVTITKEIYVDARGNPIQIDSGNYTGESQAMNQCPESKSMIPEKYGKADTSGLTVNVEKKGKNTFAFELTK
jgi:hypothetical protein